MRPSSVIFHEFLRRIFRVISQQQPSRVVTFNLCRICSSFWSGKYFINRDILSRSSWLFLSSLKAMICSRYLMVFVIFREWGPGTSVIGYVCPTTKRFLTSRKKYFVSPLTVLLKQDEDDYQRRKVKVGRRTLQLKSLSGKLCGGTEVLGQGCCIMLA